MEIVQRRELWIHTHFVAAYRYPTGSLIMCPGQTTRGRRGNGRPLSWAPSAHAVAGSAATFPASRSGRQAEKRVQSHYSTDR